MINYKTSEPKIPAIPTTYKGIEFRSRLEAKWAVMFDLLGWKWEYEPFDIEGYIPDFVLHVPIWLDRERECINYIVEVKPALTTKELRSMASKSQNNVLDNLHRDPNYNCLRLGASLSLDNRYCVGVGDCTIKNLGICDERLFITWDTLYYGQPTFHLYPVEFCGYHDNSEEVFNLWAQATNAVKYRAWRPVSPPMVELPRIAR